MAINFNNQNQGIGTLDLSQFGLMQPQNQNMQVADAYNTPTEGEYGFNLIELDKLKNAGYDPAELSTYPNQEDVQSIIRNLEPTANANNIMTDANVGTPSSIIEDEQGNLIDTENRVQFGNENFDSEPYQYTPNYLGANSPMLDDEGNTEISSLTNYGYDPAFGQLQNHFYGDTSYPSSFGNRTGYFDDYLQTQQVPSLQRALGNPRFALAPEQQYSQPKEAIYQDRIMNNNLPSYSYEPKQGIMQGLQNKISGLRDFLPFGDKSLSGMAARGLKSIFERNPNAPSYQTRSPNIDYSNLNTNNLNDFYDSNEDSDTFGTTRFDRAKPGSFGSYRTLADYFNRNKTAKLAITQRKAKKEAAIQQQIKDAAAATKAAEAAARGNYTPGGSHLSRGTSGGGLGLSQAQAQSVSQANKDAGYSSFSGLKDGGLASMFTRRR